MRLNELHYLVEQILDEWVDPVFKEVKNDRGTSIEAYICGNYAQFVNQLQPLSFLPFVQEGISALCRLSTAAHTGERAYLTPANYGQVKRLATEIIDSLSAVQSALQALGMEIRTSGFDIKLPPDITLDELGKCAKELNFIFNKCPILQCNESSVQFSGVDIGSKWLIFTVIGTMVLERLAALVDKAVMIRSHWLTCKQQEENVRKLELGNQILENTISTNEAITKKLTEQAVTELSAAYQVDTPEDRERVARALDYISKWLNKGMEIYAAIGAPEEVKAAFPPIDQQQLPDIDLKRLMAGEDGTDDQ